MPPARRRARLLGAFVFSAALLPAMSFATCDPPGGDAVPLAAARQAIDQACPCAAAASRAAYRNCAVDAVQTRVAAGELRLDCRREAMRHAKLSVCGRPGAAVCCRVTTDGRPRHSVVAETARCVAGSHTSACVSTWPSVPTGCDASGCVPASMCGNGTVDAGEQCDPPGGFLCDSSCQTIDCSQPPSACGNGMLDPGEACEPPGAGTCAPDCRTAPCGLPAPGEIAIACTEPTVAGSTEVAAGTNAGGYLLAWTGPFRRTTNEVLARRFDADALPLDARVRVLTGDASCGSRSFAPSVGAANGASYLAWGTWGPLPGPSGGAFQAVHGRRVGADGSQDPTDQLTFAIPVGQCQSTVAGPTATVGVGADRFVASWRVVAGCVNGPVFENPAGVVLSFAAGAPPSRTGFPLGFPLQPPPGAYSGSGATVASLGGDSLAVWHAVFTAESMLPYTVTPFVAAAWTGASGDVPPFILSARTPASTGRPAAAAGAASFLVAWAQGTDALATDVTEIRGLRLTRAGGRLDPDGGIPLATAGGGIRRGPTIAFDGGEWLVAWIEVSGATHDLRAVRVAPDGTVGDATPRLLAANVALVEPAAASSGDGRVVVIYARADGAATAVRATLVPGS